MFAEKVEPQRFVPLITNNNDDVFLKDKNGRFVGLERFIELNGTELYTAALKAGKRVNLLTLTADKELIERELISDRDNLTRVDIISIFIKEATDVVEKVINCELAEAFNGGNTAYVGGYQCRQGEINFFAEQSTGSLISEVMRGPSVNEIVGYKVSIERRPYEQLVAHHPV